MEITELRQKKCVPCRGGIPPMRPDEAHKFLAAVPSWSLKGNADRLSKGFSFESFPDAIAFVGRVAELAESEGHHPDLEIHYNNVEVILWTHKIDGLHENDFIMAAKIDELVKD